MEVIILIVIVVAIAGGFSKKSGGNKCPKCGHRSLKERSTLFGKNYAYCKRTFMCGWDARKTADANQREIKRRQRERDMQKRNQEYQTRAWDIHRIEQDRRDRGE